MSYRHRFTVPAILFALLAIEGCGGGGQTKSAPPPPTYTIGGAISGLSANGLELGDGNNQVLVGRIDTTFTLPQALPSGATYNVTVEQQPTGETCTVSQGSGTVISSNVNTIGVTCAPPPPPPPTYTIGGAINGLNANGLEVGDGSNQVLVGRSDTSFTLPQALPGGANYNVTVQQQPSGETCTVSQGSGTVISSNVITISVACAANTFTIGGTISGLAASGLVLQDNGADDTAIAANATSFTAKTALTSGSAYSISVRTQPAGLTCVVANGSGSIAQSNVTNVSIVCAPATYAVGGTISGLSSSGLILLDSGADSTTIPANSTTFSLRTPLPTGATYTVTIQSQPSRGDCVVSNGTGTVGSGPVTTINITCTTNKFTVGGTVDGLRADGLELRDNGIDSTLVGQPVSGTSTIFVMLGSPLTTGSAYDVTVQTQPAGQSCTVANGSGTIGSADVTNIRVSCISISVLHSFTDNPDGKNPMAELVQGSDGKFYGTTQQGGTTANAGTAFVITSAGAETVLHSFADTPDGASPAGGLVEDGAGNFFGVTTLGGTQHNGTVFEVTSGGSEAIAHSFRDPTTTIDGTYPEAGLTLGVGGTLFGTTSSGGMGAGLGSVFSVTPLGSESLRYSFGASPDGAAPAGTLLLASDGNFYGTTLQGGSSGVLNYGTVFKLGVGETVLYSFSTAPGDGIGPSAGLIEGQDGNFYGTTTSGGAHSVGTVFKITPTGTLTILHSFSGGIAGSGADGAAPKGRLLLASDGNFYGTTESGGDYSRERYSRWLLTEP